MRVALDMSCKLFMTGRPRFLNLKVFKYSADFMKVAHPYVRKNGFPGWLGEHQATLSVPTRKTDSNSDSMQDAETTSRG